MDQYLQIAGHKDDQISDNAKITSGNARDSPAFKRYKGDKKSKTKVTSPSGLSDARRLRKSPPSRLKTQTELPQNNRNYHRVIYANSKEPTEGIVSAISVGQSKAESDHGNDDSEINKTENS